MRLLIAAIASLFVAISPAAAQEWHEAETAHFIVKSRDSAQDTRDFAETMERFDRGLRFLNNLPEDHVEASRANKPVIYRFGDYVDMSRMYGNSEAGVGGFFISRAGDSVAFAPARGQRSNNSRQRRSRTESIEQVLLHEYTHYFMMMNYPAAYPRWYSEGYAEMVSTMRFEEDGSFHIGDPPQSRGQAISMLPSSRLDEMLDAERKLTGYDAFQHYVTGWLFTHYLSFDPARETKLREYLVALGNGEDSLTAATRIFGDLGAIQRDLVGYKRGPFPGYDVRPNVTAAPQVSVREITGAEKDMLDAEMRLRRGVTRDDARRIAQELQGMIAQHPQNAHAHTLLAEAEYDSRNYTAAAAAAQKATELDPQSQDAWLYRARAAIKLAESDPAYFDTAREYLATARDIDADDPRPLIEYYQTYWEETDGANVPEQAIIALEQAFDEAGDDGYYRMLLGRQLLLESRFADARAVLLPALFAGHKIEGEKDDDFTPGKLFDAIEAQDRDTAVTLINDVFEKAESDEEEA